MKSMMTSLIFCLYKLPIKIILVRTYIQHLYVRSLWNVIDSTQLISTLDVIEFGVYSSSLHQACMCTNFCNSTIVDHCNAISSSDG